MFGAFKKLVIGDNLGAFADKVFENSGQFDAWTLLFAAYAFTWQIYCDFSGYTDMARGLSRTIGIHLMINFNLPYFSDSIKDFWRRWHISLSTWFRDYVYIPLGGRNERLFITLKNIFITFLLSGIWHGAGWNYIIWGMYNGMLLMVQECYNKFQKKTNFCIGLPKGVRIFLTFHLVVLGWIIFRCANLSLIKDFVYAFWRQVSPTLQTCAPLLDEDTWTGVVAQFVSLLSTKAFSGLLYSIFLIGPLWLFQYAQYTKKDMYVDFKLPFCLRNVFYGILLFILISFQVQDGKQFIYFQF